MRNTHYSLQRFGILIVAIHFLVSLVHGTAHSDLHLEMKLWQNIFILLVITVLPLGSAVLLWRSSTGGFLLLLAAMLGSLIFGGYYHFVAAGADNVASHGSNSWDRVFLVSAVLLAITEAAGVLIGLIGVTRTQVGSAT